MYAQSTANVARILTRMGGGAISPLVSIWLVISLGCSGDDWNAPVIAKV